MPSPRGAWVPWKICWLPHGREPQMSQPPTEGLPCPLVPHSLKNFFFNFYYLFMWLCWVLGVSCIMRDLVPRPGIELWAPALGAQSLSHWTSREIPSHPPTSRGALSRSSASGGPWPPFFEDTGDSKGMTLPFPKAAPQPLGPRKLSSAARPPSPRSPVCTLLLTHLSPRSPSNEGQLQGRGDAWICLSLGPLQKTTYLLIYDRKHIPGIQNSKNKRKRHRTPLSHPCPQLQGYSQLLTHTHTHTHTHTGNHC